MAATPTPDSVGLIQIIGWSVTLGGVCINLVWNFQNRQFTTKTAADLRRANFRLDQWTAIRTKIEAAADAFDEEISALLMLGSEKSQPIKASRLSRLLKQRDTARVDPLSLEIDQLHRSLAIKQDKLASALRAAEDSQYVERLEWQSLANGRRSGYETGWDEISTAVGVAQVQAGPKAVQTLKAVKQPAQLLLEDIAAALRVETTHHDPEKY